MENPVSGERELPKSTLYSFLPSQISTFWNRSHQGGVTCLISHIIASSSYHSLPVTYVPQVIKSWGLEGLHLFSHSFRQHLFIEHLLCTRPCAGSWG